MGFGLLPGSEPIPMRRSHHRSFCTQANTLRRQFLQDGDLPFTDILTDAVIADAFAAVGKWLDRIFSPLVTLWVFLGQVLSADHSCRAATSPDCSPTGPPVGRCRARPGPGLTAEPASACRKSSSPPPLAPSGAAWTPDRISGGCGRDDGCTCSTGPR